MSTQKAAPYVKTSAENGPLVSNTTWLLTRPCKGFVQTSSRMIRGSIVKMAMLRRVKNLPRSVYSSVKASQAAGVTTAPSQLTLSQKSLAARPGLTNSNAYPSAHSATANMSKLNDVAPGVGRLRNAKTASAAEIATDRITGNTYGVNCQYIIVLLSISYLSARILLYKLTIH